MPGNHEHNHEDGLECMACKMGVAAMNAELMKRIMQHGYTVMGIAPGDNKPLIHHYTIGLYMTYKLPDLTILACPPEMGYGVISEIVRRYVMDMTEPFKDKQKLSMEGVEYKIVVRDVPMTQPAFYNDWFGKGVAITSAVLSLPEDRPPPHQQLVWCDKQHRYPWDEGHKTVPQICLADVDLRKYVYKDMVESWGWRK